MEDYLGPHRVNFASNFSGEIELNLGPIGNAYLESPASPIGLVITVGGVGTAAENLNSLFSEQTLIAYTSLYTEPDEALSGIVEHLVRDAVREGLKAEAVLLLGIAIWRLRRQLVPPWIMTRVTWRRAAAVYVTVVALVIGSILVPEQAKDPRYPVAVAGGGPFSSLTVDSVLLAGVLDRGIKGIRLLSVRQQRAVKSYLDSAAGSLSTQLDDLPKPGSDETMILGFSDLHCNQADGGTHQSASPCDPTVHSAELGGRHGQWDCGRARLRPARGSDSRWGAVPGGNRKSRLGRDRGPDEKCRHDCA